MLPKLLILAVAIAVVVVLWPILRLGAVAFVIMEGVTLLSMTHSGDTYSFLKLKACVDVHMPLTRKRLWS